MFTQEITEKIFSHKDMKKIPKGYQEAVFDVIQEVLEQEVEEYPYVYLSKFVQPSTNASTTTLSEL